MIISPFRIFNNEMTIIWEFLDHLILNVRNGDRNISNNINNMILKDTIKIFKIPSFGSGNKIINSSLMIKSISSIGNCVLNNRETFTLIIIPEINRFIITKNSHKIIF